MRESSGSRLLGVRVELSVVGAYQLLMIATRAMGYGNCFVSMGRCWRENGDFSSRRISLGIRSKISRKGRLGTRIYGCRKVHMPSQRYSSEENLTLIVLGRGFKYDANRF